MSKTLHIGVEKHDRGPGAPLAFRAVCEVRRKNGDLKTRYVSEWLAKESQANAECERFARQFGGAQ